MSVRHQTSDLIFSAMGGIYEQLGLPQPTDKDRAICNLQAAAIEAMMELEGGHPNEAHRTLKEALLEAI